MEVKIFVNNNFLEETAIIREDLLQKAKDLQSQNKVAKVVHDTFLKKRKKIIFLRHKPILKLHSSKSKRLWLPYN